MSGYNEGFLHRHLNFGIDFDDTITADPETMLQVIRVLKQAGHKVHVVTYRFEHEYPEDLEILKGKVDSIQYTGRINKEGFCSEKGINIDIWIDDQPLAITHDLKEGHFHLPEKIGLIIKGGK